MGVYSFDDVDGLFKEMRKDMDAADINAKPWQLKIKAGGYFVRWSELGFNIYGEILVEGEPRQKELQLYRLCRGYSVACPQGEMGDIHVSTIERLLTKAEFEEARKKGWRQAEQ